MPSVPTEARRVITIPLFIRKIPLFQRPLKTLFQKELGDGGNRDEGHTDYYTAITRIRSYLEKNMTYSSQTGCIFRRRGFYREFFNHLQDRTQCSFCDSSGSDVPLLWHSGTLRRRGT